MPAITPQERYMFDLHGYLPIRGALTAEECASYRAILETCEAKHRAEFPNLADATTLRMDGLVRRDLAFASMLDHPNLLPYIKEFVDRPQTIHSWSISKYQGAAPQGWHLGIHPADFQFRTLMDGTENRRVCSKMLNCIVMLTDNNPGDGCAAVLPASHKSNYQPDFRFFTPELTQPGSIEVTGQAGDIVIFTEALMHAGLRKTTPGVRANLYFNFVDAGFGFLGLGGWDEVKNYWYPPELRAKLTQAQRDLTKWMEVINPPPMEQLPKPAGR